ncbi:MAG: DUF305 domain-containing protein [Thermaceae bacterium]|nr:DUF305 domain-containing protein [Thermaceae bacterium]
MGTMQMGTKAMTELDKLSGKNFDIAYMSMMIPHYQSAIDMPKPALTKATRPEPKKVAQGLIDAQSKEIKQYQEWLKTL